MDEAALVAAGLLDPDAPGAADRRALLELLVARGATFDELVEAAAAGTLGSLLARRVALGDEPRCTLADVAAEAGVEPELAVQVWRAAGLPASSPEDAVVVPADAALFRSFRQACDLFGTAVVLQFVRVMGASIARVADAATAMFSTGVSRPLTSSGGSSVEVARTGEEAMIAARTIPVVLERLLAHHMPRAVERFGTVDRQTGVFARAVAFVDLVGSTAMATSRGAEEWALAVEAFEASATDLATDHDVSVVKFIGDEVMLVGVDLDAVVTVALGLLERLACHPVLPPGRAGAARGDVFARGGDYFGPTVHLAARAVAAAAPGTVVVAAAGEEAPRLDRAASPVSDLRAAGFTGPVRAVRVPPA
jgi:class 3 adenylate cyclase